jgi:hypothetical protein
VGKNVKEYEKIILNFNKPSDHCISFTKAAMVVCRREMLAEDEAHEGGSMDLFDENYVFDIEEGGLFCFTNSIVLLVR